MNRGDLLSWENRTDVFDGELLHSWAHSLLSAVPPQSHHGRQVLHCAVVHTARQVRELPVKAVTFCSKEFVNKKNSLCSNFKWRYWGSTGVVCTHCPQTETDSLWRRSWSPWSPHPGRDKLDSQAWVWRDAGGVCPRNSYSSGTGRNVHEAGQKSVSG